MLSQQVDYGRLVELARNETRQTICLPVDSLARLSAVKFTPIDSPDVAKQSAVQPDAELTADISWAIGAEGLPWIDLKIRGLLFLECQRCLGPLSWEVDIESHLALLKADDESSLLEDPFDSILIDADGLDLVQVIEDEILTALPLAPVHKDEPTCREVSVDESDSEIIKEPMHKPFSGLASLVGSGNNGSDD